MYGQTMTPGDERNTTEDILMKATVKCDSTIRAPRRNPMVKATSRKPIDNVWDCLGLSGTVWDCLGLSGTVWDCLGLSGIA